MSGNSLLIELRPDRQLLDPNFDGYKLSLDTVPIYQKSITQGIDCIHPSDDQFSFFHVKIFSLHNHIYVNPHTPENVYFVDKKWKIFKVVLTPLNRIQELQEVCEIPSNHQRQKGHYNVSVAFASPDLVVLSDGAGTVHIGNITQVEEKEKWSIVFSDVMCTDHVSFIISDCRLELLDNHKNLHMVLLHVEEKDKDKTEDTAKTGLFHTVLEWIILIESENKVWSKQSHRKLTTDGSVEYVALEPGSESVLIISDKTPKWIYDSECPVEIPEKEEPVKKIYSWSQTGDKVTVWLTLPEETLKSDITVTVDDGQIEIQVKEINISGKLFQSVNKDLTSWTFENCKLEVLLTKEDSGLMWNQLIPNDKSGEEIINPELVKEVHEKLAHLCSDKEVTDGQPSFNSQQLEDCDAVACDTTVFVRASPKKHSITHEISLSSFQWLFKVSCDPQQTPAVCLRHDIDACVWQFSKVDETKKTWPYTHTGTFYAFGYVQASKTQKKFIACPANLSYVAICEASRHIYLYRQPSAVTGELRNRHSGQRVEAVSKQQLVNLETNEKILGLYATNSILYVLTENLLHLLIIND